MKARVKAAFRWLTRDRFSLFEVILFVAVFVYVPNAGLPFLAELAIFFGCGVLIALAAGVLHRTAHR